MYYGIFVVKVRLSMRSSYISRPRMVLGFSAFWRYSSDFIDNLYRFGYPMLGQTQMKKIWIFERLLTYSWTILRYAVLSGTRPASNPGSELQFHSIDANCCLIKYSACRRQIKRIILSDLRVNVNNYQSPDVGRSCNLGHAAKRTVSGTGR
jgi:hypothetical protein